MSSVTCHISISLDGFVAGPNQSIDDPIGEGGMRLHEWVFQTYSWRAQLGSEGGEHDVASQVVADATKNVGAYVKGRRMFGGGDGPWDESWTGWWGEYPPYRTPVFVLTHHPREPLTMHGGTTFEFVTDGIESALERARPRPATGRRDRRRRDRRTSTSRPGCSTSSPCTSSRSCSEPASDRSRTSAKRHPNRPR
jgi:dihydrofolate reductase